MYKFTINITPRRENGEKGQLFVYLTNAALWTEERRKAMHRQQWMTFKKVWFFDRMTFLRDYELYGSVTEWDVWLLQEITWIAKMCMF